MAYNYKEEIKNDIGFWMHDNNVTWADYGEEEDEVIEKLHDELWAEDAITGNGGGWYDDADSCAHYLADNVELVMDACYSFGLTWNDLAKYKDKTICQYLDCTVRLELLYECLYELWDEEHNKI